MHNFYGSTAYRGFSIDQGRPDPRASYGVNRMRQQAAQQQFAESMIKEENRIRHTNMIATKEVKPREARMTMDQIRMKVQFREHQRRMRIQLLFDAEFKQYQAIVGERQAYARSEDAAIKRLESEAGQIMDRKA